MAFFDFLSNGFVILILLSLLILSIGFLADSVRPVGDTGEKEPLSRNALLGLAAGYLLLVGYWIKTLVDEFSAAERDWAIVAMCAVWIILSLFELLRHARDAVFAQRAGDIPQ